MFICIDCSSLGDFCFFKNKKDGLEYNYCDYCGIFWKSINGKYIEDSYTYKFFDKEWLGFDVADMINTSIYRDDIEIGGLLTCGSSNISDYILRCIRCDTPISIALNENGCYQCYNCGFEWGVVNCG